MRMRLLLRVVGEKGVGRAQCSRVHSWLSARVWAAHIFLAVYESHLL